MRVRVLPVVAGVALASFSPPSARGAQIASVTPRLAAPGGEVEITGEGFGARQGRWQVTMNRIVNHRPHRWEMQVLEWSDRRVRVAVPGQVPSDRYLVLVARVDRPTLHTNTVVLEVMRPGESLVGPHYGSDDEHERAAIGGRAPRERDGTAPRLPRLETASPAAVSPGDTLRLRGRGFGAAQEGRIVAINRGRVREARVLSWSEREVRVRVPRGLAPGEYRVLVYQDRGYDASSNSVAVRVR